MNNTQRKQLWYRACVFGLDYHKHVRNPQNKQYLAELEDSHALLEQWVERLLREARTACQEAPKRKQAQVQEQPIPVPSKLHQLIEQEARNHKVPVAPKVAQSHVSIVSPTE